MVSVQGLWATYGRHVALADVSFTLNEASLLGVIGPNGSGKSTLLRALLGLHKPSAGSVRLMGKPAREARRSTGYVPQTELVDWDFPVSVGQVVAMGRRRGPLRRFRREDREAVLYWLGRLELAGLASRQIGELSGGQRRRALLARAVVNDPRLLLLDEPMVGLDAAAEHDFLRLLEELRGEGRSVVVATHDLSCVATNFDVALCVNRSVIAFGPPQDVMTEDVLNRTFGRHLLLLNFAGRLYAHHQ